MFGFRLLASFPQELKSTNHLTSKGVASCREAVTVQAEALCNGGALMTKRHG